METIYFNGKYCEERDMPITKEIIVAYFKQQNDYLKLDKRARAKLIASVSRDFNKGTLNLNDFEFHDRAFRDFFNYYYWKKSMQEHFDTKGVARVSCGLGRYKYIGVNSEQEANKWCSENTNILYSIWFVESYREIR